MIELRGLHLGNIARSPSESVRPDLWPDHAWVPALGCTGGVVYDLCGGASLSVGTSMSWNASGLAGGDVYNDANNIASAGTTIDPRGWTGLTVLIYGDHKPPLFTGYPPIIAHTADGGVSGTFILTGENNNAHPGKLTVVGRVMNETTGTIPIDPFVGTIAMSWSDRIRIYQDGVPIFLSAATSATELAYTGSTYETLINCMYRSGWRGGRGVYGQISIFSESKTGGQILDLSLDPLLPFRRRQPVHYSVPSGGGSIETPAAMMMAL